MSTRALRVGVLLGDNLVEERLFRDRTPVTFGQSLKCALSIPGDGIPAEHALFVHDEGRVLLRVTKRMTGKLAQGGAIKTELHAGEAVDGVWSIPLEKGARGKLQIGDATILFQEIAAPPLAPRPVLPASVRGTLGDRIDRKLAVIIGASVLAHLGIAAFAWMTDSDTGSMFESPVARAYHQEVMEVTLPDDPAPVAKADPAPGAATPVTPAQTPKPIVARPRNSNPAAPPTISEDDALRFASIMTGSETGRTGVNDMRSRTPGADLEKQLANVGERQVAIGNENGGSRTQREGIGTNDRPIVNDQPQRTAEIPKGPEREPKGRIQLRPLPPEGPGTTLTVAMILEKINTVYMPGLQRCYRKGLLGDAKLGGKVGMAFTVNDRGALDDAEASGVSSEVDSCISGQMASWHFAIPKDKDGDPTDQPFKLSLALQPD